MNFQIGLATGYILCKILNYLVNFTPYQNCTHGTVCNYFDAFEDMKQVRQKFFLRDKISGLVVSN